MPDDLVRPDSRTVLLLEDDAVMANLLKDTLQSRSFLVTHVTGGAEGVQKVMAADYDSSCATWSCRDFRATCFTGRGAARAAPLQRFIS